MDAEELEATASPGSAALAGANMATVGRSMTPPIPERAPSPSRSRAAAISFNEDALRGQDETLLQMLGNNYFVDTGYPALATAQHEHNAQPQLGLHNSSPKWRVKDRMKTVSVALVVCLNIGVDPPDIVKTKPCAKLECWFDPTSMPPQKAIEHVGKALQAQYERWQPRAQYRSCLDPTLEEVKKMCLSLRRKSKDERILFHYNGHGVPKPTTNGEIWVFNKNFTQYIPLSVYDLQTWMGSPSIFVYDCSAAGNIIQSFNAFAEQREREFERLQAANPNSTNQQVLPMRDCIQLAACRSNEILPMNPNLPADLFTACLTTPIEIAIRWFVLHNSMLTDLSIDVVDKIPGRLNDRRTPLGELNWIFTAITDTIAWNVLPRELFQKLFRQDLLVASLFRNYILAERVLRSYNCSPISSPKLPLTHQHSMWNAWDLATEMCLSQLPGLLDGSKQYMPSLFFSEQLTAFEVWLEHGSDRKRAPEQLPIVLQVLLSQAHRLRALRLLAHFVDLGPWAVSLALSVGIFPYVLKLLQSPAPELRQVLVHIWAKILAVDRTCNSELVKDNGYKYFIVLLWNTAIPSDERAMAAFVLAMICREHRLGQQACLRAGIITHCLGQLSDPNPLLRQWLCLTLAELWSGYGEAKAAAIRDRAHEHLKELFNDPSPLVRAAAVYALGRFIGDLERNEHVLNIENSVGISLIVVTADAAPMVRRELVLALAAIVHQNEVEFRFTAQQVMEEDMRRTAPPSPAVGVEGRTSDYFSPRRSTVDSISTPTSGMASAPMPMGMNSTHLSVYQCLWKILLSLSLDPFPEVAEVAQGVVDSVLVQVFQAMPADRRTPSIAAKTLKRTTSKSIATLNTDARSAQRTSSQDTLASPRNTLRMNSTFNVRPLESTYFVWSAEQFARPASQASQVDNAGSESNLSRDWRRKRNVKVIHDSRPVQAIAATRKLEEQVHILDNESDLIWLMRFHSYEPRLVVADGRDGVSVWDLVTGAKINTFLNQPQSASARLTALGFINEEDDALLMTGADDGVMRFWRHYDDPKRVEVVSAWRALTDLLPSSRGSGLVTEWQQRRGSLLVSGDVRVVRVWDMERELCIQDIPTFSDSCVTTLTSDKIRGNLLIAGCGDGAIRLYDRRQPSRDSMVRALVEHRGWVVNALLHKLGDGELITGSVAGDIKFWDLRMTHSTKTIEAHNNGMSAMAVHNHAPVIASGSHNQYVKVYSMDGTPLSTIRYHDGFLGQRIGPISSMAFHPHKMLLAAGSTDSIISIFETDSRIDKA